MKTYTEVEKQVEIAKVVCELQHFVHEWDYNTMMEDLANGQVQLFHMMNDVNQMDYNTEPLTNMLWNYAELLKKLKPLAKLEGQIA